MFINMVMVTQRKHRGGGVVLISYLTLQQLSYEVESYCVGLNVLVTLL